MGDVIEFRLPLEVHAGTHETYRLIRAFVQIRDEASRHEVIALAEAAMTGERPSVATRAPERASVDARDPSEPG